MAGRIKEKSVKTAPKRTVKKSPKTIKTEKPAASEQLSGKKSDVFVYVDFPRENEVLIPGHYAIRLGSAGNLSPEVSINGNSWQKCRFGAGFWWYDWSSFPKGIHKIEARVCDKKGNPLAVTVRNCLCKS